MRLSVENKIRLSLLLVVILGLGSVLWQEHQKKVRQERYYEHQRELLWQEWGKKPKPKIRVTPNGLGGVDVEEVR